MRVLCDTPVVMTPISELRLNPNNRNQHPKEQIERLAKILSSHGWRYPVKVSIQSGMVVSGHGRVEAAILNGWSMVPVQAQDYPTPEEEYQDSIADNAIALWSELDFSGIHLDLSSIGPLDLDLLGIKNFHIETVEPKGNDGPAAIPAHPKAKTGDLFLLGKHRLLCGDSTQFSDLETLCGSDRFDMVFTSPPYNVGIDYATHNDNLPKDDYWRMVAEVLHNCYALSADNCWTLWNVGASVEAGFDRHMTEIRNAGFEIDRAICWKKKGITGPPIFAHTKNKNLTKYYMPFFGYEFIFTCFKNKGAGQLSLTPDILDRRMTDVWEVDQSVNSNDQSGHPAAFPVQLAADAIGLFCDDIVYEPFCGSGTTLIAAEQMGRRCFGMEKAPGYVDSILDRWQKYTEQEAFRLEPDGNQVPWNAIKK